MRWRRYRPLRQGGGGLKGGRFVVLQAGDDSPERTRSPLQTHLALDHRPYPLVRHTPALYERNQSRTNTAPCKRKSKREGSACLVGRNVSGREKDSMQAAYEWRLKWCQALSTERLR